VNLAALVAAGSSAERPGNHAALREWRETIARVVRGGIRKVRCEDVPERRKFSSREFRAKRPGTFQKLEKQGILLRERSKDIGPGFVRITIGTQSEMRRLLKSIRKEWKAWT